MSRTVHQVSDRARRFLWPWRWDGLLQRSQGTKQSLFIVAVIDLKLMSHAGSDTEVRGCSARRTGTPQGKSQVSRGQSSLPRANGVRDFFEGSTASLHAAGGIKTVISAFFGYKAGRGGGIARQGLHGLKKGLGA